MSLNCKLNRNISLVQPGEGGGDGCNGQDISMGVGGISSPVLVYNIGDVASLKFENDNRADDSLTVDTINSTGQFYKIDFTSATYNEEYENHKWTHTLTLEIANITPLFEDLLSDGVNGKYLVCFKPNGAEDYRMFGWKYGASLDYSLNITEDSLGYTVTLTDTSEYPLFNVYKDNFGSKNKTYSPIFKPLYDVFYCEMDGQGKHTGYIVAMYVVKVNSAGQPLDEDNKLCQWSGKKQDAYKYQNIQSDGGYHIIGTYASNASFDGRPVKILDYEKCPANVTNSIYINSKKAETINLNSTITGGTYTITSTDEWMMVSDPQFVTIEPVEGLNGSTHSSVHHNGVGGVDHIQFMNKITREIVTLDVNVNIITVGDNYTYNAGTTSAIITPTVEGCSSAYTYTISPSVTSSKDENGYIHIDFPDDNNEYNYTMTLTHSCDSNEVKVVHIKRYGKDITPTWSLYSSACEIINGEYTRIRIDTYIDVNPESPTFNTTKTERVVDNTCSEGSPSWVYVSSYCEKDTMGKNTGYYVSEYADTNPKSPTYQQTKQEKVLDSTHCPGTDTNPTWIPDPKFEGYCEQIYYEPAHIEENSGYWIGQEIDDNPFSPTYGNTRPSRTLSSSCPAPSTLPDVEEVSYSCVLVETEDGFLRMTGEIDITGIDTNVFSATYLQVTTVRRTDTTRCPPNNPQPAPTGCTAFIIDGGHINVAGSGDSGCDSAFLWVEATPVFTPASASSWVTIDYYHWDTTPAAMCTNYRNYPCVANNLMYDAGLVDSEVDCSTASHNVSDYPQIVQDAINGTGKYAEALGTMRYNVAANPTSSQRTCTITFDVGSTECPSRTIYITQAAGGSHSDEFKFNYSGHETNYSTGVTATDSYFVPSRFTSYLNGAKVNAVLSASESWVITNDSSLYYNGNELKPEQQNSIYLYQNTTSSARTATITLTQKGTSNTITINLTQSAATPAQCTITSFSLDASACQGDHLNYSYTVNSTTCQSTFYFQFFDANGNYVESQSSPSGGSGSGYFNTSSCAIGQGSVTVVVGGSSQRYTANIQSCGIKLGFEITNSVGSSIRVDTVDFVSGVTHNQVSLGQSYLIENGTAIMVTNVSALQSLNGKTYSYIRLKDTQYSNVTFTTTAGSGTIRDNSNYRITADGIVRELDINNEEEQGETR